MNYIIVLAKIKVDGTSEIQSKFWLERSTMPRKIVLRGAGNMYSGAKYVCGTQNNPR